MMRIPPVASAVCIAVAVAFIVALTSHESYAAKSCHLRELDLCLASVLIFAQTPTQNKVTEVEINKQCSYFGDTQSCVRNYTSLCSTKQQRMLIDFAADGVLDTFHNYCTPGTRIRKLAIKHGECINIQRPRINKCLIDFQAAVEAGTSDTRNWKDRPKMLCCAYDRFIGCNTDVVTPACGREAIELGEILIRSMFSRGLQVSCHRYKHNSPICKSLLPPKGTQPKGPRSQSVISRLMSTVTGVQ